MQIAPEIDGFEKVYERLEDVDFELAPHRLAAMTSPKYANITPHIREYDYLYVTYRRKRR